MTPTYRADIDGLRAIAVSVIVLFHAGVDGFDGGYVGVDIFFVISGFLITTIICRELDAGQFSLAAFYERRVRRILPALIATLLATLLAGLVLLTPAQLEELAASAVATSFFGSNVYFFQVAGYFDGPSEAKPLLHTWSLAVEEQFYILFPLLLMWLAARRISARAVVVSVAVLSLLACVFVTATSPTAAFYLIPFRAWELMLGALIALGAVPVLQSAAVRTAAAAAGLALILASVGLYSDETAFPGVAALMPTAGAALLIVTGQGDGTAIHRGLSLRPLVFIGLISYSLYLWHWPVMVYAKQYLINEPGDWQRGFMVLASIAVATVSWRYVEAPFRNRNRFKPRRKLFAGAAAISISVTGVAAFFLLSDGLPQRNTSGNLNDVVVADPGWDHWKDCEERGELNNSSPALCDIGEETRQPRFLFWGDSHALALASAVNMSARDTGQGGLLAVRTACPPLLGIDRPGRSDCAEFNDAILDRITRESTIDTVIIAARWTLAADGHRYKSEEGREVTLVDLIEASGETENRVLFERGLRRTLSALRDAGKRIVVVDQVPEIGYDVPAALFSARLRGSDVQQMVAPTIAEYRDRTAKLRDVLAVLRREFEFAVVEPASLLCDDVRCRVEVDGVALYRDDNHLSLRGCVLVARLFRPLFD